MNKKACCFATWIGILLVGLVSQAQAGDKSCSTAGLKGSYGYTVTGFAPGGSSGALVPFVAVGRIVFDGKGNVSTKRTLSVNGAVTRGDVGSGTYTVNSDCSGSFTITATGLGLLRLDLQIDDDGEEIRAIVTNPGFVLTLEGKQVDD